MKIFVVGYTGTGKTSIATWIAEDIGGTLISGSSWIKKELPEIEKMCDRESAVELMTKTSQSLLSKDHRCAAKVISAEVALATGTPVIEGLRNPTDFVELYNPSEDLIIYISRSTSKSKDRQHKFQAATAFERLGIAAIKSYVDFCISVNGIVRANIIDFDWQSCEVSGILEDAYEMRILPKIRYIKKCRH